MIHRSLLMNKDCVSGLEMIAKILRLKTNLTAFISTVDILYQIEIKMRLTNCLAYAPGLKQNMKNYSTRLVIIPIVLTFPILSNKTTYVLRGHKLYHGP